MILYYTIVYYSILYHTLLYNTILHYTTLYYTILYYTILYYTILHDTALLRSVTLYKISSDTVRHFHLNVLLPSRIRALLISLTSAAVYCHLLTATIFMSVLVLVPALVWGHQDREHLNCWDVTKGKKGRNTHHLTIVTLSPRSVWLRCWSVL